MHNLRDFSSFAPSTASPGHKSFSDAVTSAISISDVRILILFSPSPFGSPYDIPCGSDFEAHHHFALMWRHPYDVIFSVWRKPLFIWIVKLYMSKQPKARKEALVALPKHQAFRAAHPREEHFVPIYVAAGAGEEGDVRVLSAVYGQHTVAFGL